MNYQGYNQGEGRQKLTAMHVTVMGVILAMRLVIRKIPSLRLFQDMTRFGFGFVGSALSGAILGPWYGGIVGVVNDIISMTIGGGGGTFFPGYTLNAFLGSFFYGVFLWRKPKSLKNIFLAVLCVTVIVNLLLGSLWVVIMQELPWAVVIIPRLAKNFVSLFFNTTIVYLLFNNRIVGGLIDRYQF